MLSDFVARFNGFFDAFSVLERSFLHKESPHGREGFARYV